MDTKSEDKFQTNNKRDSLELSIISNAPFAVGFLERILDNLKSKNAPFQGRFWDMVKLEPHRNSPNLQVCLNG